MIDSNEGLFEAIFNPKSVAVVGASSNILKGGYRRFVAISENYQKGLYPVNPKEDEVAGFKAYHNIKDIPGGIDHVIISIPSQGVRDVLRDCVDMGVKVVTIYASGYSETGEDGRRLEEELLEIAHRGDTRIIGPNCIGVYCPSSGLSFQPGLPNKDGDVAFISQSGGMAILFVQTGSMYGIGYSRVASFGNAADLDSTDYLEFLADDPKTSIIAAYIEGVKDGRRFIEVVRHIAKKKPLIIWKVGRTDVGIKAISSHTGALVGEDRIWDALFRQFGVARVDSLDELIDTVMLFKYAPSAGQRLAVITIGGGAGVATADICTASGLTISTLSSDTTRELKRIVPSAGTSIKNPVDLAASALDPAILARVLKLVDNDESVDTLILLGLTDATIELFSQQFERLDDLNKPLIIIAPITSEASIKVHRSISRRSIPIYPSELRAARAISNLIMYKSRVDNPLP